MSVGVIPEWERAHGEPITSVEIRRSPQDFQVTEELGFELSADGEHDYLWVQKTDANTDWVARQLARHAKVGPRDVGYAGLKDRRAVTRQWFSVRRPNKDGTDWQCFAVDGVTILKVDRNARKLRRGAHRRNQFRIALFADDIGALHSALEDRMEVIARDGVPNYFGEQRFGAGGGNIALAESLFAGKKLRRDARSFALSAARSFLFNVILDQRVEDGSWNRLLVGELANLDSSGSVFSVQAVTADLIDRCERRDVHPTATLWGNNAPLATEQAAALELNAVLPYHELTSGLTKARIDAASRALRVRVQQPLIDVDSDVVWLQFSLTRGAYATAVLRELVRY